MLSGTTPQAVKRQGCSMDELNAAATVIKAADLCLTFPTRDGEVHALSDVCVDIQAGEFVSLIGPSGCGKTTLLRCIADLEQPTSGELEIGGMSAAEARQKRVYGYVFQAPALYPWRTVEHNVSLPHEIFGTPPAERDKAVRDNLELVGLSDFERKYPWQLSGGMQQRVSIARALSFNPDLLLMDEPFGALDEITRDRLNLELLSIWARTRKTVVFVTHSIPEAVFLSTRIVVMSPRPGRITAEVEVDLPAERSTALRDTAEFVEIAHRVREALAEGEG